MKPILRIFRDVVELYVPISSFIVMFFSFIMQVFFRYVLHDPLSWTQEIIVVAFAWLVLFGSCYTMRTDSHVKFTLVYDTLGPRMAAATRMLGNLIIVATFSALIVPSYDYSLFQAFQKTAMLRIPYTALFLPFVYFVISIICYTLPEIVEYYKVIARRPTATASPRSPR